MGRDGGGRARRGPDHDEDGRGVDPWKEKPHAPSPSGRSAGLLRLLHDLGAAARAALARLQPSRRVIVRQYRKRNGRNPALGRPRGLSEKICWLMLHEMSPLHTRCADKIAVRDYVAERVGAGVLIPSILTAYDLAEITPERIPNDRFVIKTNHDTGGVVICADRSRFDWREARDKLATHLAQDHWLRRREPAYRGIRRGVLVEEYLEPEPAGGLREYKVFCFHGRPEFVMAVEIQGRTRVKTILDTSWRRLPVWRRNRPTAVETPPRPETLPELLRVSAALSAPFRFCRVDLYEHRARVRFGEITFYPEAGREVFEPPEWERRFGDLLRLPTDPPPSAGDANLTSSLPG